MTGSLPPPALSVDWFARPATEVAPDSIGCMLVRKFPDGQILRGRIVETEAYTPDDPACHAYRRQTPRNSVMFGAPGRTYIYRIYGIYHCLNLVTDLESVPSAVLIRAIELDTLPSWVEQSAAAKPQRVAAGPGKLCRVLDIDQRLNGQLLAPDAALWLEPRTPDFQQQFAARLISLTQTTRIGLTQGVDLPWRWYLTHSPAVSKVSSPRKVTQNAIGQ